MKNQEAGNILFSLTDNIQVLLLGGDEKKAHPIHQNPSMTARTYVKSKVVFSWRKKKKKEGVGRSKQKHHLKPTLTYIFTHFLTEMLLFPSTPASLHLPT